MEKKDSEINELNTKLNERNAELQSLKSDKKAADEQLVMKKISFFCFLFNNFSLF